MKIIVDAMGGDNAPEEIIKGALDAVRECGVDVVLVGGGEAILRSFDSLGERELPSGIEIVNASEVIGMDDDPANAVRVKKDASLTVAFNLLRDEQGDALVSAGNTGALLSGATLIVKRVRGIRRAALAPVIPNAVGSSFVIIDSGANVECTPEYLLQFAFMGSFYSEDILKVKNPRIGLLNNGTERTKGTQLQLDAYELLENAAREGSINFIGNVEAKGALLGGCDVLVCDGFTGNIMLKSLEGMASMIMSEMKSILSDGPAARISALLIKNQMYGLKSRMDADSVGGTMLLGISKPVIKAHGSSNAAAICNAIKQATAAVIADSSSRLQASIARMTTDKA